MEQSIDRVERSRYTDSSTCRTPKRFVIFPGSEAQSSPERRVSGEVNTPASSGLAIDSPESARRL